ncbi:MAG: prolipoprotein diacylglyceryl transferase [Helicobacter sp.]|uniref:prolipoprotein diacylglyceryl transferase n=1 Tax=Helicobacter sp. 10-6591 TaxID=2004998 RepID=UPI000DCF2ED8|nr:prolipoprotein diacylglyceryl transferase [Helicobacter sp. 10-6591]MCI6217498.1 prolipoprotein diacylglyceryl transferase [Helicobacter sp.]RAX55658.1 prolipoprotein diacylglyceryl transferase [Helicobacter sp. 10-6591]
MALSTWNLFYSKFDPIAFEIFFLKIHWYGICYVVALVVALFIAQYFLKHHKSYFGIDAKMLDSYFVWSEVGVILGARIGYVTIYGNGLSWDIFNPFDLDGNFVGIAGFSYHGGVIGFVFASVMFCFYKKQPIFSYLDLATLCIPLAYVFGRIGNFLNQELYGRIIDIDSKLTWIGILVDGHLRYPSQLFEAFFEGIVVFIIMLSVRRFCKKRGQLACVYGIAYALARFFCEYFREADAHMGYYAFNLSMGQILSVVMFVSCVLLLIAISRNASHYQHKEEQVCKK